MCLVAMVSALDAVDTPSPSDKTKLTPWFHDVAAEVGLSFDHVRATTIRLWFPEIMSGGGAWADVDGDGNLDLYLVQGGELADGPTRPGNRLFLNRGRKDAGPVRFADVTVAAGVGDTGYGMGCAAGDHDGDGDVDLFVTNVGANVLYRNDGVDADGQVTFTDVTAQAGVGHPGWGTSATFLDHDLDGDLDLFVVNYINWAAEREIDCHSGGKTRDYCHPDNYNSPAADVLYRNNGDGTFSDISREAGLLRAFGNGLGVASFDFNRDGLPDVYVANDGNPNQLWINLGGGRFEDRALLSGCAVNRYGLAEAGMGVAVADLEADDDLDFFVTHLRDESNTFYVQQSGYFEDATVTAGLSAASIPYTGFGTGFADFDHDGELDLLVVNGRVGQGIERLGEDAFAEPNLLWRGQNGRFVLVDAAEAWPGLPVETSRAALFGDYDNDGDLDVAVVNSGGPLRLLENRAGERGAWVKFRAVDERGREVVGAEVMIEAGGRRQARVAQPSYSYLASNDPRVHFGLGQAEKVERVEVVWPGRGKELFGPFAIGRVHELRRGTGQPLKGQVVGAE